MVISTINSPKVSCRRFHCSLWPIEPRSTFQEEGTQVRVVVACEIPESDVGFLNDGIR